MVVFAFRFYLYNFVSIYLILFLDLLCIVVETVSW